MKPLKDVFNEWPLIGVCDVEAGHVWIDVICICHMDEYDNKIWFHNRKDYFDWLFSPAFKGKHVWSHWGGHYDIRFMIAEAYLRYWSVDIKLSGSQTVLCIVTDDKGRTINFCESARLMPDSLAKIGKSVGIEKIDIDRSKLDEYPLDIVVDYCFNDCKILLKGLQDMRKVLSGIVLENGKLVKKPELNSPGCDFAYTLASICTRYIRRSGVLDWRRFYEKDEKGTVTKYSEKMLEADKFCEAAYYGGNNTVFRAGKFGVNIEGHNKKIYTNDISSSYPSSMMHELPAYFLGFRPPSKDLDRALSICAISEATVFIPRGSMYLPVLPVRHEGRLVFPEGHFRGRWANPELKFFWDRAKHIKGAKLTIHVQAVYEPMRWLKPFVDTFWELRKQAIAEGDEFKMYVFKICMNSAYGKLVESLTRQSILTGDAAREALHKYGPGAVRMTPTPRVWALETEGQGPFRHVAAGCYVTAYSRIRLLEGIEHCLRMGANVYYCDTDCIFTDKPCFGFEKTKELGKFSLEHVVLEAEIYCSKVYKLTCEEKDDEGNNIVIYKAKGMPVKGLSQAESKKRFEAYTQKFQDLEQVLDKPIKDGIGGLLSDINKGFIEPKRFQMERIMQHPDTKRIHMGTNSWPIYLELLDEATGFNKK